MRSSLKLFASLAALSILIATPSHAALYQSPTKAYIELMSRARMAAITGQCTQAKSLLAEASLLEQQLPSTGLLSITDRYSDVKRTIQERCINVKDNPKAVQAIGNIATEAMELAASYKCDEAQAQMKKARALFMQYSLNDADEQTVNNIFTQADNTIQQKCNGQTDSMLQQIQKMCAQAESMVQSKNCVAATKLVTAIGQLPLKTLIKSNSERNTATALIQDTTTNVRTACANMPVTQETPINTKPIEVAATSAIGYAQKGYCQEAQLALEKAKEALNSTPGAYTQNVSALMIQAISAVRNCQSSENNAGTVPGTISSTTY